MERLIFMASHSLHISPLYQLPTPQSLILSVVGGAGGFPRKYFHLKLCVSRILYIDSKIPIHEKETYIMTNFTLTLDPKCKKILKCLAESEATSQSQIIRKLILAEAKRQKINLQ